MRICFVSHSSQMLGAERALLELVDGLIARGIEPCMLLPAKGPLAEELSRRRVPWQVIPYTLWIGSVRDRPRRVARCARNLLMSLWMALQIRRWACDVVYSNTMTICAGAIAAWIARKPHLWHIHELLDHISGTGQCFDLGERSSIGLIDRLSSIVVVNSKTTWAGFERMIPTSKMRVIYQSVSPLAEAQLPAGFTPLLQGGFKLLILGGAHRGKRLEDGVLAVGELTGRGKEVELWIAGGGIPSYLEGLSKLVVELGLQDRVRFLGFVDQPGALVDQADAMLVCAGRESFGRVIIEAMLKGKPVIAARDGGSLELVSEGQTGILFRPGDVMDLADKIAQIQDDLETRKRLGEKAREWASGRFTQERYAGEILDVLEQVVTAMPPESAEPRDSASIHERHATKRMPHNRAPDLDIRTKHRSPRWPSDRTRTPMR